MQSSSSAPSMGMGEAASGVDIDGDRDSRMASPTTRSSALLFRAAIFVSLHLVFVVAGILLYST